MPCTGVAVVRLKTLHNIFRVLLAVTVSFTCFAEEVKVPVFFPPGTFDDFIVDWYSGHLKAMNEEALPRLAEDKNVVVYRFTCLPTFDHPFVIRITKMKDGFSLRRKVLSGAGGYDPGKIEESVESDLKGETISALEKLLLETKFDELSTVDYGGLDGSQWILEVVKNGEYRIVDRWSPKQGSAMRKIGEWFLTTAKWQPKNIY
jgi:hypothetical protein